MATRTELSHHFSLTINTQKVFVYEPTGEDGKLRRNEQFKEIFIISEGQLVSQPAAKKNKFIDVNTYNTHGTQALSVHTLTYSERQWHREQTKVFLFIFDGFSCFMHYSTLSMADIFFLLGFSGFWEVKTISQPPLNFFGSQLPDFACPNGDMVKTKFKMMSLLDNKYRNKASEITLEPKKTNKKNVWSSF